MLTLPSKQTIKQIGRVIFWLVTVACYLVVASIGIFWLSGDTEECPTLSNVASIPIRGQLIAYGELPPELGYYTDALNVVKQLETANEQEGIEYIILDIDSPGGEVTSAEDIVATIQHIEKPVYALIRSQGLSAGFWIASAADLVYAYPTSMLGNMGTTYSFIDNSVKNESEGITFNELSSGKFKDITNPDKELTAEERANLQENIDSAFDIMAQSIADSRKIDVAQLLPLADGRILTSKQAIEAKLIDHVGTRYDLLDALKYELGTEAIICQN